MLRLMPRRPNRNRANWQKSEISTPNRPSSNRPGVIFGQAFIDLVRAAVREEMRAANGNGHQTLLTAEQLAKALGVNKATVYEWVKAKTIPYYQAGRFVRFNLNEVLASQKKISRE